MNATHSKLRTKASSFLAAVLLLSFYPAQTLAEKADTSRIVCVGDSLVAGFQNFSLVASSQVHSFANVVARQARSPLILPLIAEPGIPSKLIFNPNPPPLLIQAPGLSSGRVNPTVQVTNLAVPGHAVDNVLNQRPEPPLVDPADGVKTLTNLVLGLPTPFLSGGASRSQVEWVEEFAKTPATRPTLIIGWFGSNDALGAVLALNTSLITPPDIFRVLYRSAIQRLRATGATLVVGNVPDVTAIPFLTRADKLIPLIATLQGVPPAALYGLIGVHSGDYLSPDAANRILQGAATHSLGPLPLLCNSLVPGLPFTTTPCFLTAAQINSIRSTVAGYNGIIAEEARGAGAGVVNIHALFTELEAHGIVVGGRRLTTKFLGGLFSLDAVHPSNTGQAIVANEFIKILNREFAAGIPPVSLVQVMKEDPLVFQLLRGDRDD